ncbi:MAG: hypothetical protein QXL51_01475 [Candidatus Aenigmatarchaeota archaeon]
MYDDYEKIKQAFENKKGVKIKNELDINGNPILKIEFENKKLIFYFDVDEYEDKAYFSYLVVLD